MRGSRKKMPSPSANRKTTSIAMIVPSLAPALLMLRFIFTVGAMRILVTGGAGFIGSHLVEKLLAAGHEVSILDDFNDFYDPRIKRENIGGVAKDIRIHEVDLRNRVAVCELFQRERPEAVAHLAARAGVR